MYLVSLQLKVLLKERVEVEERRMAEEELMSNPIVISSQVAQNEANPQDNVLARKGQAHNIQLQ